MCFDFFVHFYFILDFLKWLSLEMLSYRLGTVNDLHWVLSYKKPHTFSTFIGCIGYKGIYSLYPITVVTCVFAIIQLNDKKDRMVHVNRETVCAQNLLTHSHIAHDQPRIQRQTNRCLIRYKKLYQYLTR